MSFITKRMKSTISFSGSSPCGGAGVFCCGACCCDVPPPPPPPLKNPLISTPRSCATTATRIVTPTPPAAIRPTGALRPRTSTTSSFCVPRSHFTSPAYGYSAPHASEGHQDHLREEDDGDQEARRPAQA